MLKEIDDRFGNWIKLAETVDPLTGVVTQWTITDSGNATRTSVVTFKAIAGGASQPNYQYVIDSVTVPGPNGPAKYTLHYSDGTTDYTAISGIVPCGTDIVSGDHDPNPPHDTYPRSYQLPLLNKIDVPAASSSDAATSYEITYTAASGGCRDARAASLTLPTRGSIKWTYGLDDLPQNECYALAWTYKPMGVVTRQLLDSDGTDLGTWVYHQAIDRSAAYSGTLLEAQECPSADDPNGDPNAPPSRPKRPRYTHSVTSVTLPNGSREDHHFTLGAYSPNVSTGPQFTIYASEYGSPQFRPIADPTNAARYLSSQTFDCTASSGCSSTPSRTKYLRYVTDGETYLSSGAVDSVASKDNPRTESERTVFEDSSSVTVDHSDYDGFGHFRKTVTSDGNGFATSATKTSYTNYNAGTSQTSRNKSIAGADPWLLGTYNYQWVNENNHTATMEACFDATTGALKRLRTLSSDSTTGKTIEQSPTESSDDMLLVLDRDTSGNINKERYFGGDGGTRVVATGGCSSTLPSTPGYDIRYGWTSGVLSLKRYYDGTTPMFMAIDRTIDGSGAVTSERDSAGVETTYSYDDLGRLTTISPTGETASSITYVNASGTTTRAAATLTRGDTSATTTFDGLGRTITETHSMPGSVTALRATTYDLAGRNSTVSEFDDETVTPSHTTSYTYDIFDRPLTVTAPDGKVVTNSYTGVQSTLRSSLVQGVGATITASTTERYDPLGRLAAVTEGSGAGGANVTTTYAYDVGDRLKSATTSNGTTQTRTFTYDNRGLLQNESHPEKSATTYGGYDARGHATQVVTGTAGGAFDLLYTYDAAERLTKIEDLVPSTSSRRPLKAFTYASANSPANCTTPGATCDARTGKLLSAVRTNYDATIGNVDVTSSFFYRGVGGRPSQLDVAASQTSGFTGRSFTVSQAYNGLGLPSSITYPTCVPACSAPAVGTVGTVSLGYTTGLLTSVGTYASSLTYRPNGVIATVVHGNGLTETWGADSNGMARPSSITATKGTALNWTTGTYGYDGAGNIAAIGSKSYAYDQVNRLVEFKNAGATSGYTYDAFGNQTARTYKLRAGDHFTNVSVAIPVDPATNHLKEWHTSGLAASTYDAAGNQLHWTTTDPDDYKARWSTGVWDAIGSMHSLTTSNGSTTYYIYDAADERLATVVRTASTNQSTTRWTLRGLDNKLLRTYTDTNGSFAWTEDNIFRGTQLLANESPTGTQHYALDHLGSPRVVTNASGALIGSEDFAPFGEGGATGSGTLQFTGHERDWSPAGGSDPLDYMHARWYEATSARFLSPDPVSGNLGNPGSWNRYAYVRNNPVNLLDPYGLFECDDKGNCKDNIQVVAADPGIWIPFWWVFGGRSSGSGGGSVRPPGPPGLTANPNNSRSLSRCEESSMRSFFPGVNLNNVRIHEGADTGAGIQAVTEGYDIYVHPGVDTTDGSIEWYGLLSHELAHTEQYVTTFHSSMMLYVPSILASYGLGVAAGDWWGLSPYESAADLRSAQVMSRIMRRGSINVEGTSRCPVVQP